MLSERARRLLIRARWTLRRADRGRIARTVLRWAGGLAVLALLALPAAVLTAQADRHFGPHEARYSVDLSGEIVVDLGPLGTIVLPAEQHLPLHLGVRAEIKEIPADVAAAGSTNSIGSLSQDIAAYGTFFASPQALIDDVVLALVQDVLLRELAFTVSAGTGVLLLRLLIGADRRRELGEQARRHPLTVATAASTVVVLLLAGLIAQRWDDREESPGNAVFAGTPLEGARVTGRMSAVVDEVGALVSGYYQENEEFYAAAQENLRVALEEETAETGTETGGEAGTDALVPRARSYTAEELSTFLLVSDVHCNVGMAQVVQEVIARMGVEFYIDAGDVTMNGTPAENYCVDASAAVIPEGMPKLFVKGNHDTEETEAAARRAGFTVLDGDEVELGGVTFLGDADPRYTQFGVGTTLEGEEDLTGFGTRMAEEGCATPPDVLLVHDPRTAYEALGTGCVPLALSGHWHRRVDPRVQGLGIQYVNSTTGGALANALTPGPLRMDAEMTILRFDPESGRAVDYRVVTVREDESVDVGSWQRMPSAPLIPARSAG